MVYVNVWWAGIPIIKKVTYILNKNGYCQD